MRLPNSYHLAKIFQIRASQGFMLARLVSKQTAVLVYGSDFHHISVVDGRLDGERRECVNTPTIENEPEIVVWLAHTRKNDRPYAAYWGYKADLDQALKEIGPRDTPAPRAIESINVLESDVLYKDSLTRIDKLSSKGRGFPRVLSRS